MGNGNAMIAEESEAIEEGRGTKAPPTLKQIVAPMNPEQRYQKFRDMLKGRGMTVSELARLATKSSKNWPHVTAVLRGIRNGDHTWPRLADFLTQDELVVLGKEDLGKVAQVEGS